MALSASAKAARQQRLVDSAHALIRESGAGFSMLQLAEHAGVSPATPYNLLGSKTEVLRLVIRDEFASFTLRLATQPPVPRPLDRLLQAVDLVVVHYAEEPAFYQGLYRAALGTEVRSMMSSEGLALWRNLVTEAREAGDLAPVLSDTDLTTVLLRAMSSTTQAWLADAWPTQRFADEMARATRLLLLGLVSATERKRLLATLKRKPDAPAGP